MESTSSDGAGGAAEGPEAAGEAPLAERLLELGADPAAGLDGQTLARLAAQLGPFAVVDFETTGLAGDDAAELLEVGALLVDLSFGATPGALPLRLRTLSGLVRPVRGIPKAIQRLTGITPADVEGAPSLARVAPPLRTALAGRVLIAHNADFERWFLARHVDPAFDRARYLDTQDLLAVTHPDAPDLRLETFTRGELGREERHRALEDALDAARVLSRVGTQARRGEPRCLVAREALAAYAPDSPWLAVLAKPESAATEAALGAPPALLAIGASDERPVPFDEEAIAAVLADEARGRRHFDGYRVRPAQIELARHFVRALRDGSVLLLEGGTGVGKSLAYLAAAIPFAMERAAAGARSPVVISTRTKLLQDQLLSKDIAAAARFLGWPALRAVSIKGRANYVCARRLESVLAEGLEPRIFAEDRMAYAVLLGCARTRPHGEIAGVAAALRRRFPPLHGLLHRSVATRAEQCSREQCGSQGDACPFGRRRAALAKAQLVVANHDLLLRWPPDYPSLEHVIADEAHELAGVADEVYAQEVRPEDALDRLDDVFGRPDDGRTEAPLLPSRARRAARRDAAAWRRGVQQDLVALGRTLAPHANEYGELQVPERPGPEYDDAARIAGAAADRLDAVAAAVETSGDGPEDEEREGAAALLRTLAELRGMATTLRLAFAGGGGDAVAAFEGLVAPFDRWRLAVRPVSPAALFHERFLSGLASFSGVSASLFVGADAFAAVGDLELEQRAGSRLARARGASPFDYASHMRVVALRTPEAALVSETVAVLALLARRLGGRVLGLFTSLRRMRDVAELLAEELRSDGIEVLMPRRAFDDPAALVARFRGGNAVLLGSRTFWQGLDIPGVDLQAVVIEKLPFEVPTELRRRREERLRETGVDPFARATLGRMLLNLKQMVGRLIRTEDDRGVVVIVEGRPDKRYFRRLAEALPEGQTVRVVTREELDGVLAEVGLGAPPDA
ncbi:MAG TPA: helicase C-terminal domain-containing protein [Myxococcota bacterium]|nr:helicase C-terminal domain-containing protein [Myxococcota bacterium]